MARAVKEGIIGSVYMIMDYATVTLGRKYFAWNGLAAYEGKSGSWMD